MNKNNKIFVAGHRGLVGSAIMRELQKQGYHNLITRTRQELDLTHQAAVNAFFADNKPDHVFLAAAKVGGILAHQNAPADFIWQNLQIQNNILWAAKENKVKRLLFLGSSCIYPRECPQPIKEEYLLTGPLEQTNQAYSLAKIAGIETCKGLNQQYGTQYLAAMPTNLYGPYDNYDLQTSHVIPALIRKMHEAKIAEAKQVVIWGTGTPKREFLHSDDLAQACIFLMNLAEEPFSKLCKQQPPLINIGRGEDLTIAELARLVADVVGFTGEIVNDASKPDGTPRKVLNVDKMNQLGWYPSTELRQGIEQTYLKFTEKMQLIATD